jgi:hypothetical protein
MSPPKEVGPDANNARANLSELLQEPRIKQDNRFDDFAARGRRRGHALRSTDDAAACVIRM